MNEDYELLKNIIGIDLTKAIPIFKEYIDFVPRGYNKDTGGFPEELVAFLLDMKRPKNIKGPDLKEKGEIKSVKSKFINNTKLNTEQESNLIYLDKKPEECLIKLRNCGNPPISNFEKNMNFFNTNVWLKIKKVIFIYHLDNIIIDIRIFDGEKYKNVLNNDYELIKIGKNSETKILTLKEVTGSIQIKKFMDIFLSDSIIEEGFTNNIINQEDYINELFLNKLISYKEVSSPKDKILIRIENYTKFKSLEQINELEKSINKIFENIKDEYKNENLNDNLNF